MIAMSIALLLTFNEYYKNKCINYNFNQEDLNKDNNKKIIGHYFKLLFNLYIFSGSYCII